MEKTEFAKLLRTEVEVKSGREVKLVKVKKNNGVELMGFSIIHPGKKIAATTYVENYWDSFEAGEMSLEDIAKQVVVDCENGMMDVKDNVLDFFLNYDLVKCKCRLGCRLINYERNKEMLQHLPHKRVMDLAVVYQWTTNITPVDKGSIMIENKHLEAWGVSEEQFISDAEENMKRRLDPVIIPMEEITPSIYIILHREFGNDLVGMYVMSNWEHNYGAVEMIYGTSTLKEFADKMESDLYVLPCSVHEVILIPLEYDEEIVKRYNQMVREINKLYVEPEEVLADHAYFFSREEGSVRLAE